ncbi:MAG: transcriptional regulator, GntR family with aminotransferase domain protein [Solirubrobacterales bacterium]|nr:transcriptional regulator, GntR family with aminotransferase domain protein [Solirubrobacterales bacterium]
MSYKVDLSDLDRAGAASLTAQMVERFSAAIDAGKLAPGEKLPTTRALAEDAGVNHLTAVRVYRRLAELGYVTATVGRGTFVRSVPPARAGEGVEWQRSVLPRLRQSYPNEMLAASLHMPSDPRIVSLATGWPSPDLYPAAELARLSADIFADLGGDALAYSEPDGLPALREELAQRGRQHGFASDADEILVTSGARQGIDLACRTVVAPGDVVVCESPTFIGILSSLQATGARVIGVPVDEDGMDVDALERVLARHEVKLVALQGSSQNPTGRDLSDERAARLIELARERSFFVLEDGVYATVRFGSPERRRLRERAPEHVIYVDSLSKTIGGGLRLGWMAATGPVRSRLGALKMETDLHTSSLVQRLAQRYLASGHHEQLLERMNPVYADRAEGLLESLHRRLGDEAVTMRPLGGHHLWVTFERPIDERQLWSEAIRQGVGVTPGGATMAESAEYAALRLSFSYLEPDRLDEGVRRLAAAVRAVRRRQGTTSLAAFS